MTGQKGAAVAPPESASPASALDFWSGFWRLADPKITLASMASLFLGACFASRDGALSVGWLLLTIAGIFFIEVAKNASGEIFDFDSGTDPAVQEQDRSPFSGGKRVLVDGLLTRGQTKGIAAAAYGLGIAAGLAIVVFHEWAVLWLGMAGIALAYFYHAPPLQLSYRGLGEAAVALCYGPLISAGTYLVQRGGMSLQLLAASLPLGILIGAFLWVCEFPDYLADRGAGKRNLVVKLGRVRASRVFTLLVAASAGGIFLLPLTGLPWTVTLGGVSLVPAAIAARRLILQPEITRRIIPAQALTLGAFLLLSIGCGLGALLG